MLQLFIADILTMHQLPLVHAVDVAQEAIQTVVISMAQNKEEASLHWIPAFEKLPHFFHRTRLSGDSRGQIIRHKQHNIEHPSIAERVGHCMRTGADPEVALWVLNPCPQLRIRDLIRS